MYTSLCAIRSWNWNWKLTQDNFLIEHWIQRTHRCSAVRCWPWGIYSSWLASRDLGTTRSSYLAWVGPVMLPAQSWCLVGSCHKIDTDLLLLDMFGAAKYNSACASYEIIMACTTLPWAWSEPLVLINANSFFCHCATIHIIGWMRM